MAQAGPDATTNFLMNDSPSMLDWGMFRMEQSLGRHIDYGAQTSVHFSFEDNQIVIRRFRLVADQYDPDALEIDCSEWFSTIRVGGYVDPDTGEIYTEELHNSRYADMFSHNGYTRTVAGTSSDEILPDIDKRIFLSFQTIGPRDELHLTCTGPLLDTGFSTKRKTP